MQPLRFIVIREQMVGAKVHEVLKSANQAAPAKDTQQRGDLYARLKLESLLQAPQNSCVVCEAASEQDHGLGRQSMLENPIYSVVRAIQNLRLAARTEGVEVRWVSILHSLSIHRPDEIGE
jgi:5,6-dimethylbenzimidazole synthase